MAQPRVLFTFYDSTSTKTLLPVAKKLDSVHTPFLYLNQPYFGATGAEKSGMPSHHDQTVYYASNYTTKESLLSLKRVSGSLGKIPKATIVTIEKHFANMFYDISNLFENINPDIIVTGHDAIPFLTPLIKYCCNNNIPTIVIQHGVNRSSLDVTESRGISNLNPDPDPQSWVAEILKRKIAFPDVAFTFCNPHVREVHAFGSFFTQRIRQLRAQPPTSFDTNIVTTGSTEYNPTETETIETDINTILFLSQWHYERGDWESAEQQWVSDTLKEVEKQNGASVVVRPHPKESKSKIHSFYDDFEIHDDGTLNNGINQHDAVISYDSTAVFPAVIFGKPLGILEPPWTTQSFEPFTHPYITKIGIDNYLINPKSATPGRQKDYLQKYCYIPGLDESNNYDSPVEYCTSRIMSYL